MNWKQRSKAAGIHLMLSASVALMAAACVFFLWFPYPYREISGGRALFTLVVAVDIVLGPLLTWVIFDVRKPRSELMRDLAFIAVIQLAALTYGLLSVYEARPVYLVHEVDRFVVISAADVDPADLPKAPPDFQQLPFSGVRLIGVRDSKSGEERLRSLELAIAGKDLSMRPEYWQLLSEKNKADIRLRAKSLQVLMDRSSEDQAVIQTWLDSRHQKWDQVVYLPLTARGVFWTVLLDRQSLDVVGYLPIDSF